MTYDPQFLDDVTIKYQAYNPQTGQVETVTLPVNPVYCLTDDSCKELLALFPFWQHEVRKQWPLGYSFVPGYHASAEVPFIVFTDSIGRTTDPINAGLLGNYWHHGYTYEFAFQSALQDILQRFGY